MPRKSNSVIFFTAVVSAAIIFTAGCSSFGPKGAVVPGQHARKFETKIVKHVGLDYYVYLPGDYDPDGAPYPFMLFLHGAGERGNDLTKVKMHGPPMLAEAGKDLPFVIVSPQCPDDNYWADMTDELKHLVDHIVVNYNIDTARLYCTGLSMGGFGTWSLATRYPDLFAAIAPVCGGGTRFLAPRLKDVPVWVFHGAQDGVVPIWRSEVMVEAIRKAGGNVRFTIYPDAHHNSWTETYDNPELYEWFLSHRKH